MQDVYFIFNNKKCTDMGVEISEFPALQHPEMRVKTIEVDGMDGSYTQDLGAYNTYKISIECVLNKLSRNAQSINEILKWLKGSGKLILSTDPMKYYEARISSAISIESVIWIFPEFKITFEVQPFRKSVNEVSDVIKTDAKSFRVFNKGDVSSRPIITLKGNGEITVKINDNSYLLQGVTDSVTINSEMQEVYNDTCSLNTLYKSIEFPEFQVGVNEFEVIGNVSEIEIIPNWRWF